MPASFLSEGSKFSANAETQLVSYNSTLKELAAFLSNILSATYAELYGDVDGQELTVTPSQVTPLKDSIAIFQSGLATREALAPRVLTAIGLTQSEIEAEARAPFPSPHRLTHPLTHARTRVSLLACAQEKRQEELAAAAALAASTASTESAAPGTPATQPSAPAKAQASTPTKESSAADPGANGGK